MTHIFETLNRLELVWGIQGIPIDPYSDSDEVMKVLEKTLLDYGLCKPGDKVVLAMGLPVMERGTTNSLRVYTIKGTKKQSLDTKKIPLRCR